MLCSYALYKLQTTGDSAVELPGQLQTILELIMDISSSRLNLLAMTGDVHLAFLSPFSITGLFLVLEAMGSLDPGGNIDTYLLRYKNTFMDVLRCHSSRWRLAGRELRATVYKDSRADTKPYRAYSGDLGIRCSKFLRGVMIVELMFWNLDEGGCSFEMCPKANRFRNFEIPLPFSHLNLIGFRV